MNAQSFPGRSLNSMLTVELLGLLDAVNAELAVREGGDIAYTARRPAWPAGKVHKARFVNDPDAAAEWRKRWMAAGYIVEVAPVVAEPAARPFRRLGSTNEHYTHPDGLGAAALLGGR